MIVRKPEQRFPTAPEGTHPAVCVDEIDLGKIKSVYNGKERERHMVRIVWQIDETNPEDGKPYLIKQDYTASLDEKAKLRAHLKSWRGRDFTFDEEVGFEMEQIVGAPCLLGITHNTGSKGGTFANVTAVMKLPKGFDPIKPEGYVRVKDRVKAMPTPAPEPQRIPAEEQPPYAEGITDDDVPF